MALRRLKWLKYLFIGRSEGETEQRYWNEKRKAHLANEHSAGIVDGLEVTATTPPSLLVRVAGGRAIDADGNDPEVESVQELDLVSVVPGSGTVTVYIALSLAETEVEPYFVDETGEYQNKYVQDGYHLEVLTTPPADPAIELARIDLAAGATEITDAADPENPGLNEIDLTHRERSGWEAPVLAELADVSPDESDAFNNMNSPSASNPVATIADVAAGVSPVEAEVAAARGSKSNLDERLDVALEDDGSLKGHAGTHKGDGSDAVAAATGIVAGLMSVTDKSKLDGVEAGAIAAGEAGDAHAAVATGNPHDLDPADVGAAPASHVGASGGAHAAATGSVAGFMPASDKAKLNGIESGAVAAGETGDAHAGITTGNPHNINYADAGAAPSSHVGAGGVAQHATATVLASGFMSADDKFEFGFMQLHNVDYVEITANVWSTPYTVSGLPFTPKAVIGTSKWQRGTGATEQRRAIGFAFNGVGKQASLGLSAVAAVADYVNVLNFFGATPREAASGIKVTFGSDSVTFQGMSPQGDEQNVIIRAIIIW